MGELQKPMDIDGNEFKIDLHNCDCYDFIKTVPDNSVDLVIIDPPYEFAAHGGGGAFGSKKREYHNVLENTGMTKGFDLKILDEIVRVLKKINIYIWCSKRQIRQYLNYFKDYNLEILTWHKSNPVPACNNTYLSDTEYILFFREKGVPIYGNYETKRKFYISPINKEDKKLYSHPTIKPLNIIENLVINSSLQGGVVLDCFMGSGTTGVACKKLGRSFIGCEINEEYFKIAERRINDTN